MIERIVEAQITRLIVNMVALGLQDWKRGVVPPPLPLVENICSSVLKCWVLGIC